MAVLQVSEAVQVYREFARVPSITSASVIKTGSKDSFIKIYSEWSQRDLERMEKNKYSRTTVLQESGHEYKNLSTSVPHELGNELWNKESPSGNFRAVVRKTKNKKGDDKFYVEIWNQTQKLKTIDVGVAEKHGDIYEQDGTFGCFEWSSSEGHLLYTAEKKLAKTVSYFDAKAEQNSSTSKPGEEITKGDENVFKEDWGELLVGKHRPVLCVLDIESGSISTLDSVPDNISPGQGVWCPDDNGVVFIGWPHEPFRLGLIYCPQRQSAVYHIDLTSETCSVIGQIDQSVRSLSFSPDKTKLVFLQNPVGGPHIRCSQLVMCDWKTKCCSVVVDEVSVPETEDFQGLFLLSLASRCWANDNTRLLLSCPCRSKNELFVVNTETQSIVRLTKDKLIGTWSLLDVYDDSVVAATSSPSQPQRLVFGKLPPVGEEQKIVWHPVDSDTTDSIDISWEILKHEVASEFVNKDFEGLDYESILLLPNTSSQTDRKPPLVVHPHGGPHTCYPADFFLNFTGLCKCGFAVLLVNYRGSIGFGQFSVDSLPGNVGTQDVYDVYNAATSVLDSGRADKDCVFIAGGSHGGFLTAHLIGQFPEFSKAAVLRNPVINIARPAAGSMLTITDIPDWCKVESGLPYNMSGGYNPEAFTAAWERSPIRYVQQVKTPALLMIGAVDKRVPPKQGEEYYRALKTNNCKVRMLMIPDNSHPLNKVDCEADCFMNIYNWFTEHM